MSKHKRKAKIAPALRPAMAVSAMVDAFTRPRATDAMQPDQTWARPEPLPGVLPAGMAMDDGEFAPAFNPLAAFALKGRYHEGLGFLGYPYLAELSQRPEYRLISEKWAMHATRKWIKFNGDETRIGIIDAAMKRFNVQQLFRRAAEVDGQMGRVQIFIDLMGDGPAADRENEKPLTVDPRKIGKGKLRNLKLVEPFWTYPGTYETQNPLHPDFYRPRFWYVMGKKIDASRMLTIVGREMPDMLKPVYQFGGLSLSQMVKPYVDNFLRGRQSASDLLHSFSVMVLQTNLGALLQGGGLTDMASIQGRGQIFNSLRDNNGLMMVDKDTEALENVSAPLAGVADLVAQSQEQIASAASMPLVVWLGVEPTGLNASSEGGIQMWYDTIKGYQEKTFRGPLQRIVEVIQLSECGDIDPDLTFEFVDLWEMDETAKAQIIKTEADADAAYIAMGAVSNEEVRDRLSEDEQGLYFNKLKGDAPEPPEEEDDAAGAEADGTKADAS